jgi:DNA-binding MarR family transcriptional regulator
MTQDPTDPVDRLDRAIAAYNAAERRLKWWYRRHGGPITRWRLPALRLLAHQGEATPGQLAREAELNPATITEMLDQLEAEGAIRRRRDDHDKRVWWISLTDTGRAEVQANQQEWKDRVVASLDGLPPEVLDGATEVLERLAATYDCLRDGGNADELVTARPPRVARARTRPTDPAIVSPP